MATRREAKRNKMKKRTNATQTNLNKHRECECRQVENKLRKRQAAND